MGGMAFTATMGSAVVGDNWDFADANPHSLSGIHPYPAKFIPEIPRRLIEAYRPAKGLMLLDPFCGVAPPSRKLREQACHQSASI